MQQKRKVAGQYQSMSVRIAGTVPGTFVVDPDAPQPVIRVLGYSEEDFDERECRVEEIQGFLDRWPKVWIQVAGLGDEATLRELSELLGLHRLALADVVNLEQRAKMETYDGELFLIARKPARRIGRSEQVSLFLGQGFLLSFQEREDSFLNDVLVRIRTGQGRVREAGVDYLAYSILDALIDSYFPVLEMLGERLASLEEEVLSNPTRHTVLRIHAVKRELRGLRRAVWPHREVVNAMLRDAVGFVGQSTSIYLRDCYDHVVSLMDQVESHREFGADLMSTYLSITSNRMNEVMKLLSIVATIFIPITFIAGIYGMNFDPDASRWNMPELGWLFGYPFALGLMLLTVLIMLLVFRRKGWFR